MSKRGRMVFPVQIEEVVSTVLSTHQHSYTSLMASHSERKRMDLRTASYSPIVPESIHVGRKRTQKEAPRSELTSQTTNQCHLPSGDSRRQKLTNWWKEWVPAFSTGKGAVRATHFVCRRGVVESWSVMVMNRLSMISVCSGNSEQAYIQTLGTAVRWGRAGNWTRG